MSLHEKTRKIFQHNAPQIFLIPQKKGRCRWAGKMLLQARFAVKVNNLAIGDFFLRGSIRNLWQTRGFGSGFASLAIRALTT
jgi:hypothetical protein